MENLKDFTIATTFILVCSAAILFFAFTYPSANGYDSVLLEDPVFNQTAQDLQKSLGSYQEKAAENINVTTSGEPQASAQGLYMVTETKSSRNVLSQLSSSFKIITSLLGNVFGLSGTQFSFISGAILSLFSVVLLYYVIRAIRWGN